jgi:hypothetical protein
MFESELNKWSNIPLVMRTRYGTIEGQVKYGTRKPISPATTPLSEHEKNSRETLNTGYWFVEKDDPSIKIRLLSPRLVTKKSIKGIGYNARPLLYTIKKK